MEFAFPEARETTLLTLMPMLPPIGSLARKRASIFIETTPNGKNYFYTFWQLAKSGESDWMAIFIPWTVAEDEYALEPPPGWKMTREQEAIRKELSHHRHNVDGKDVTAAQMYWRECEMANQGWNDDKFASEYPGDDESCFLLQSHSLFKDQMRYLQHCVVESEKRVVEEFARRDVHIEDGVRLVRGELRFDKGPGPFDNWQPRPFVPRFERVKSGRLCVWSPPQLRHAYFAGLDTAQFVG